MGGWVLLDEGPDGEEVDGDAKGEDAEEVAEVEDEAEGGAAEGGDGVEGEGDGFDEGVFGDAGVAGFADVFDGGLTKADPGGESAHVAVLFGQAVEGVDGFAVDEAEVTGVDGHFHFSDLAHETIKDVGEGFFEGRFAFALGADGVDDLVALLPFGDEIGDDFGGVLEVGVDDDGSIAGAVVHAGGDGTLVAEVSGELDIFDGGVVLGGEFDPFEAVVGAAIVDEEKFELVGKLIEEGGETLIEQR